MKSICILLIGIVITGGCGQKTYNKRYFALDIQRHALAGETTTDRTLKVEPFTINPAFASKSLVYRKSRFQFETDFYNEFLIPPAELLTQASRQWMSQSGLFGIVSGNSGRDAFVLQANILALYGDFSQKLQPKAVAAIQFFMTHNNEVVLNKAYKEKAPLETLSADGLMAAYNQCLELIMKNLESDMRAKLDTIPETTNK